MIPYTRAEIRLNTATEVNDFVSKMNTDSTTDKYIIEDFNGIQRANARSFIGALYAVSDFSDGLYLVNLTHDAVFPAFVDAYRA